MWYFVTTVWEINISEKHEKIGMISSMCNFLEIWKIDRKLQECSVGMRFLVRSFQILCLQRETSPTFVLEGGMATPSSIPAWRIPVDIGAWWAIVYGVAESRT